MRRRSLEDLEGALEMERARLCDRYTRELPAYALDALPPSQSCEATFWTALADRCVLDALRPISSDERIAESLRLAAYCFERSRRSP